MPQDILIVEDIDVAAHQYGNLISLTLGREPFVETSPFRALKIVERNPIKVLVVDQKMHELTGTELVSEIQKQHPGVVSIMLTGLADKDEVGEAVNLGFFRYIHKRDVTEELVPAVEDALRHYDLLAELRKEYKVAVDEEIARVPVGKILRRETLKITLQSVDIEKDVTKDDWQTEFTAKAGMKTEEVRTFEVKESYQLEHEFSATQEAKLGIKNIIDVAFQNNFGIKVGNQWGIIKTRTVKRTISAELEAPDNLNQRYIAQRDYQVTGLYDKYTFVLEIKCSLCQSDRTTNVVVYVPKSKNATQQIDYYSDGTTKTLKWRN